MADGVASFADCQRDIEEQGFHLAVIKLGNHYVWAAFAESQMRGVNVSDWAAKQQALAQQVSHGRENLTVYRLIRRVVSEHLADGV